MDPNEMNLEQLTKAIQEEAAQLALRDAREARAISPVEVKAPPSDDDGPSEQATWTFLAVVTIVLAGLCLCYGL